MDKSELCEQDSAVEIQYMTGGKINEMFHKMISRLFEMHLAFKSRKYFKMFSYLN